jgi:hypothetical protein
MKNLIFSHRKRTKAENWGYYWKIGFSFVKLGKTSSKLQLWSPQYNSPQHNSPLIIHSEKKISSNEFLILLDNCQISDL